MSYTGIFIRDAVGDTPNNPKNASWTNSPDIMISGPTPLKDPSVIVNVNNYNQGLPQLNSQTPLQNNWVYVRGINSINTPQTSTFYLYYVDTSIVLWPQNWKYDTITFNTVTQNWQTLTAQGNGITGTTVPFGWTPPRQGIHYCTTVWVNNGTNQLTPPNLYAIGAVNDMANFIMTHPNVGWKNTIEVDATQPTIQNSSPIIGPTSGGVMNIGVQCQNLPTDGYISFSVPGPDSANTIIFPRTKIISPNYAPTFQVSYPPGFNTSLQFIYEQGPSGTPDGANLLPIVGTYGTGTEYIDFVRRVAPKHLADVDHYGTPEEFAAMKHNPEAPMVVPPSTLFIVGSVPFRMTK
jgi:hypothetical protein